MYLSSFSTILFSYRVCCKFLGIARDVAHFYLYVMTNLKFTSFFKQRFNFFTQFLTMDAPFTPVYGNLNLIFISVFSGCITGVLCCFHFNTLSIIRLPTCLGNPLQEI